VLIDTLCSSARGFGSRNPAVLVDLVLYQPQILLDYAALVWRDWESVDVPVGDG